MLRRRTYLASARQRVTAFQASLWISTAAQALLLYDTSLDFCQKFKRTLPLPRSIWPIRFAFNVSIAR